jgi:hypothetical protein
LLSLGSFVKITEVCSPIFWTSFSNGKRYVLILTKNESGHILCHFYQSYLATRGPFLTSPLAPRGEICPLGGMFTPSFTPRDECSLLFRRMEGTTENFTPRKYLHPQEISSPPGNIFTPRGQNSSLGDNFAPGVKVCP